MQRKALATILVLTPFWGYWMGAVFGNIAFISLFFKTLNSMLGPHQLSPLMCVLSEVRLFYGDTLRLHGLVFVRQVSLMPSLRLLSDLTAFISCYCWCLCISSRIFLMFLIGQTFLPS